MECTICMETKERCLTPCREVGHCVCEDCWEGWSSTREAIMVMCPVCRETCFKAPLLHCDSFVIVRDHFEWQDYHPDDPPVEIHRSQQSGIHSAFDALRTYLQENRDIFLPMLQRLVRVQFYRRETGEEHVVAPYVIDYAIRPPTLNIMEYYEMTNEMDTDELDDETEIISSIDTDELDDMHEYDVHVDHDSYFIQEDDIPRENRDNLPDNSLIDPDMDHALWGE